MDTYKIIGLSYFALGIITLLWLINERRAKSTWNLKEMPSSRILVTITRIAMGILFIYSGFVKANDYIGFNYKLEEYFEVFAQDIPAWDHFFIGLLKPWSLYIAWFVSVLEIALGFALIVGWRMRITTWFAMLLLVFFLFLTWYSWWFNKVTDCGCFGDALKLKPYESLLKDLILIVMLLPVFLARKSIQPFINHKIAGFATFMSFAVAGAFAYACYMFLPWIDYRPYAIGVPLQRCTTESVNGEPPKCKDWDEGYRVNLAGNDTIPDEVVKTERGDSTVKYHVVIREGKDTSRIEEFKGNVLMVIMYDMNKAPDSEIQKSIALYNQLKGTNIRVMGMTGTGKSDVIGSLIPKYKIPYQMSIRDMTMLKTIIRSNPGYMLLQDGIVIKKWHYNLTPTEGELKQLVK